jgi:hypothetical protein
MGLKAVIPEWHSVYRHSPLWVTANAHIEKDDQNLGGPNPRYSFCLCLLPLPSAFCLLPTPYSLLPTPYSLLPTPYSLLPTPYSLLPTPYSLLPTPFPANTDALVCCRF